MLAPGAPGDQGSPAPVGAGPATATGPMTGSQQQGMSALKTALEALQKALPLLPMGSPLHQSVIKAVGDIGKHMEKMGAGGPQPGDMMQQLVELARAAKTNPNMAAMMPGGAGGGPPPPGAGAPPAPPMA